jgi:hypothetical protein
MPIQIADATVLVNDEVVGVLPNTVSFTEGLGEQKSRAVSIGGGKTEQVTSNDVETNYSMVKFEMPVTVDVVKLAKVWKTNGNANVVQITSQNVEGSMTRSFAEAMLTSDYEVNIGSETSLAVEFKTNASI